MEDKVNFRLIIEGCRENNPNSQAKLYRHFYGYGMNIALRYTKTHHEAEEILNDGFLRIFKSIDRYDSTYPFKYWLRKIMINAAIDYYRKFQKNQFISTTDNIIESTEEVTFQFMEEEDVLPIIQQLSPAYRMVFNLYVMENYKHHEIAEMLQISVGTSKSNLARAKEKLKEMWLKKKIKLTNNKKYNG